MPRGDGTGPMGMGPMTGRAVGYCAGYNAPGYIDPVFRRGVCGAGVLRGAGRGNKWRNWYHAAGQPFRTWVNRQPWWGPGRDLTSAYAKPMSKEAEIDMLKTEAANLENALQEIRDRLAKISEER